MKDEIISFETAKSAKNKGFNIPQLSWYNFSGLFVKGDYIREYQSANGKFPTYTAPTQSLLQRWLREKHQINIESNYLPNIQKFRCLYKPMYIIPKNFKTRKEYLEATEKYYGKEDYDTYEQALEKGLQEGLKLITSKT